LTSAQTVFRFGPFELRQRLWPDGTFVDFEQGLNAAMTRLRQTLGDTADSPRYIQTEARLGYRLIVPVKVEGKPEQDSSAPYSRAPYSRSTPPVSVASYRLAALAGFSTIVTLAGLGLYIVNHLKT
jgi:DNA-binding winged helix-turn-helix (wHTH) protein